MSQKNVPSKEDLLRAKAAMRKKSQGLSEVRVRILNRFSRRGLHEFLLFYSSKADTFGSYVFFDFDQQVEEAIMSGLAREIENAVFKELEKVGRGARRSIKVDFEFDSHENVELNYEGNYYNRLR